MDAPSNNTPVFKHYRGLQAIEQSVDALYPASEVPADNSWQSRLTTGFEYVKTKGLLMISKQRIQSFVDDLLKKSSQDLTTHQITLLLSHVSCIEQKISVISKIIDKSDDKKINYSELRGPTESQIEESDNLNTDLVVGFQALLAYVDAQLCHIEKKNKTELLDFYAVIQAMIFYSIILTVGQRNLLKHYIEHLVKEIPNVIPHNQPLEKKTLDALVQILDKALVLVPSQKGFHTLREELKKLDERLILHSQRVKDDEFEDLSSTTTFNSAPESTFPLQDQISIYYFHQCQSYFKRDWINAHESVEQEKRLAEEKRIAEENQRIREVQEAIRKKEHLHKFKDLFFKLKPEEVDLSEFSTYKGQDLEESLVYILKYAPDKLEPEQETTLFLLYEKVAERYQDEDNIESALRIRLQARTHLPSRSRLKDLVSELQKPSKLGVKIDSLGCTVLKNHVLYVAYTAENKTVFVEGRLSHYARAKLEKLIIALQANPDFGVTVSKSNGHYVLAFKDQGSFTIGDDNRHYINYMRFNVETDVKNPSQHIYEILTFLGMGEIGHPSRAMDDERKRIFQLFRAYHPQQVFPLERAQNPFEMPIASLKERMISLVNPKEQDRWREVFHSTLNRMYQQEVYPGFRMWAVRGLSQRIVDAGAVGLMIGVGCVDICYKRGELYRPFKESALHVLSMLKMGVLSSYDRGHLNKNPGAGVSPGQDLAYGGGDSVFCRMVLAKWINDKVPTKRFAFSGHIQLIIDICVLDRVGYGYGGDCYGSKIANYHNTSGTDPYRERHDLITLTNGRDYWGKEHLYISNEMLIKHRLPPEYIKGILVQTEKHKQHLMTLLVENNMLQINGKHIQNFIHVGDYFKKNFWA